MQPNEEYLKAIKRFNRNVEKLLRLNKTPEIRTESIASISDTWLSVPEAMAFIKRSRSWLARITVNVEEGEPFTGMALYRGADWKRETNRIYYRQKSLENLKIEMQKAGDRFDDRLDTRRMKSGSVS